MLIDKLSRRKRRYKEKLAESQAEVQRLETELKAQRERADRAEGRLAGCTCGGASAAAAAAHNSAGGHSA